MASKDHGRSPNQSQARSSVDTNKSLTSSAQSIPIPIPNVAAATGGVGVGAQQYQQQQQMQQQQQQEQQQRHQQLQRQLQMQQFQMSQQTSDLAYQSQLYAPTAPTARMHVPHVSTNFHPTTTTTAPTAPNTSIRPTSDGYPSTPVPTAATAAAAAAVAAAAAGTGFSIGTPTAPTGALPMQQILSRSGGAPRSYSQDALLIHQHQQQQQQQQQIQLKQIQQQQQQHQLQQSPTLGANLSLNLNILNPNYGNINSLPTTPMEGFRSLSGEDSTIVTSPLPLDHPLVPERSAEELVEEARLEAQRSEAKGMMSTALQKHLVFETIPTSGKVVVFDSELQVRYAFSGLVQHGVNCAPVWNHTRRGYIGLLSVTDFLEILVHTYERHKSGRAEIGSLKISEWQQRLRGEGASISKLLCVAPEVSLLEAAEHLLSYRVHRLAVVTDALAHTVLCFLTQHKILEMLLRSLDPTTPQNFPNALNDSQRRVLSLTVREAKIGRFQGKLVTGTLDTPVLDALRTLKKNRITALPLLDPETGSVVDAFSRSDIRLLVHHDDYEYLAERPLKLRDILAYVRVRATPASCSLDDTIIEVAQKLYVSERHQLLCLNEKKQLNGIVSLTDLFAFIVGRVLESNRVIAGDEQSQLDEQEAERLQQQQKQLNQQQQKQSQPPQQQQLQNPENESSSRRLNRVSNEGIIANYEANNYMNNENKDESPLTSRPRNSTNARLDSEALGSGNVEPKQTANQRIVIGGGKIVGLSSKKPKDQDSPTSEINLDQIQQTRVITHVQNLLSPDDTAGDLSPEPDTASSKPTSDTNS